MNIHNLIAAFITVFTLGGCAQNYHKVIVTYPQAMPRGELPESVRPNHYKLDLKITPEEKVFSGEVAIDVTFDVRTRHLWIHGQDLEVSSSALILASGQVIDATYTQQHPTGIAKLEFAETVNPGEAVLKLVYRGAVNDDSFGIFLSEKEEQSYVFTQFEAIYARQAFPGFDDPGFKVPFDISLTVPSGQDALASTPEVKREDLSDGFTKVTFATSKPLPSYLVAFAVGPFDIVEGPVLPKNDVRGRDVKLRGVTIKGEGEKLGFALNNTAEIVEALEEYFQIPYPYAKIDLLAVPGLRSAAMENVGAITYQEFLLLLGDNLGTDNQKFFLRIHAHELAHQWFGNLVTHEWWNDIWLNEAFATWMGNTILEEVTPEHKFRETLVEGAHGAMKSDDKVNVRHVRQPISRNEDIMKAFNGITYQKGGGVLAMLEAFMGREQFRAGVQNYLNRFAFSNASADDFITAVAEKSDNVPLADIRAAFNSFLEQPGIPYLDVSSAYKDGRTIVTVRQSRYLPLGSKGNAELLWKIPACFGYGIDGNDYKYCTLLSSKETTFTLPETGVVDYLMPNLDGVGYYRYALDHDGWLNLLKHKDQLSQTSLLSLYDSLAAAVDAGTIEFAALMKWAPTLIGEPSRQAALLPMDVVEFVYDNVASSEDEKEKLTALARKLYAQRQAELGFETNPDEDLNDGVLRITLIEHMAVVGRDQELRQRLIDLAKDYTGFGTDGQIHDVPDYNVMPLALRIAQEELGMEFGDHLFHLYRNSNDSLLRVDFLRAMAASPGRALPNKMREMILGQEIRGREASVVLYALMRDPVHGDATWQWLEQHFESMNALQIPGFRYAPLGSQFCSLEKRDEVKAFFEAHADSIVNEEEELAVTLESIELCAAKAEFFGETLGRD